MGLYVETLIRADIDEIWRATQDPGRHQRWDLRFTRIDYAPGDGVAVRFRYATCLLPGVVVTGTGITLGERRRPDGTRTSALRFASPHRLSPIREGAGYWRYVPTGAGVRFLTGYDYRPGGGWIGAGVDRLARPLLGWATAWSFDRLRLWLERGINPGQALRHALTEVTVRVGVTAVALVLAPWWLTAMVATAAILLPPAPGTPAARRCRRRPPDRHSALPPSTLDRLANG